MQRIGSLTEGTTVTAQDSARSAAELAILAAKLSCIICRFKLENQAAGELPQPAPAPDATHTLLQLSSPVRA